jgi:hypothetical protein
VHFIGVFGAPGIEPPSPITVISVQLLVLRSTQPRTYKRYPTQAVNDDRGIALPQPCQSFVANNKNGNGGRVRNVAPGVESPSPITVISVQLLVLRSTQPRTYKPYPTQAVNDDRGIALSQPCQCQQQKRKWRTVPFKMHLPSISWLAAYNCVGLSQ